MKRFNTSGAILLSIIALGGFAPLSHASEIQQSQVQNSSSKVSTADASEIQQPQVQNSSSKVSTADASEIQQPQVQNSSSKVSTTNASEVQQPQVQNASSRATTDIPWGSGGVMLSIDENGKLTISSGTVDFNGTPPLYNNLGNITPNEITSIDISGPLILKGSAYQAFGQFPNLTTITNMGNIDTSQVTKMGSMFGYDTKLTSLDVSDFNTSQVTDMSGMFIQTPNVTSLNVSNFDTSKVTDMSGMFAFTSAASLDVSNFDTSKVTDMQSMFTVNPNITNLDLSHFDTSQVTSMRSMFYALPMLKNLNVSSFNTSKVIDMAFMFDTNALSSLNVNNFDTSQVTDMELMFAHSSNLRNLDVSSFDTSQVTNMSAMFDKMPLLTSLDLSNFDTSKVTAMDYMFNGNTSLTSLNLSNFDTSQVINMEQAFNNTSNLNVLKLGTSFKFGINANLPDVSGTTPYTGKWQNVGSGTLNRPAGSNVWSSAEFMSNYASKDADTYVWQKVPPVSGGAITVHYQDDKGNKIGADVILNGYVDDTYTTDKKTFPGYTFKAINGNATGQFTSNPQEVTYVYTKDSIPPVSGGAVTVHYQDDKGNKVGADVILNGNVNDAYTTDKKTFPGYTFKAVKGHATGHFTSSPQEVTYVYTKNAIVPVSGGAVTVQPQDNKGNSNSILIDNNIHKTNPKGLSLPQTGENERTSLIAMILGLLFMVGTAVLIIFKRKENGK